MDNVTSILWEEKNSTEQKKNLPNSQILVPNDITNDIKKIVIENPCEDTGKGKKWTRNCPMCNKEISYNYKWTLVEYDEKHHNFPKKKNKDKIRQENLIKELNCSFYRYNESKRELIKIQ
jgi:hypothetical protein